MTLRCEQGPGEAGRRVGEGWRGQSAGGTPQGTGVRAGSRVPKSAKSDFNKKGSVNSGISILLNLQHGNLQKDGLFGVCQLLSDALAGPRALCG